MPDRLKSDLTDIIAWQGTGLVLVIEDELLMCEVAREMLEAHGLTVLTATDGQEGMALFREHAQDLRAVLLDLKLPGKSGEEVLREIHHVHPQTPVILVTGLEERTARPSLAGLPVAGFIQKPFYLGSFLRKVREVLERRDEDSGGASG
ncbi:MAG TPA: response regulator [Candidatus Methylomirabilis sp.]|nr:response regulator [Candidatus Methylomirabilis sp.]